MSFLKTVTLSAIGVSFLAGTAFAEECIPSKWGKADEIGSANLVTTERVIAASKLIKQGKTQPLGITIDANTPAFPPRGLSLQVVQPNQQGGGRLFAYDGSYNDDLMQLWLGIGSQLDGLGHLGQNGMYYNCNDEKEFAAITGLTKLGTHNVPPLVGRGVVLDMAKFFGKDHLPAGKFFTAADVQAASKAQGVTIGEGDIVLFHTGWTDAKLEKDPTAWASAEPGISEDAAVWLAAQNVMAVGADTWGVDVVPPEKDGRPFWGHVVLLKENGIYILETMNTGPLVRDNVTEFMFVLGQPKVRGTVQMIINPVAMY